MLSTLLVGFVGVGMENFHDKLADMTKAELESLFNDEEKIRSMVHDSPSVKQMEATKNRLMKSNQQKASMNLKSEPQMEKVREDLIAAHHDFSETLKEYTNYKSKLGKSHVWIFFTSRAVCKFPIIHLFLPYVLFFFWRWN